jgi:hypothetical protein
MRFVVIVAIAAILTPAALSARAAPQPGAAETATDLSAAKKKKKPAKPKEEYLKGASGLPSGPQRPTPQY